MVSIAYVMPYTSAVYWGNDHLKSNPTPKVSAIRICKESASMPEESESREPNEAGGKVLLHKILVEMACIKRHIMMSLK